MKTMKKLRIHSNASAGPMKSLIAYPHRSARWYVVANGVEAVIYLEGRDLKFRFIERLSPRELEIIKFARHIAQVLERARRRALYTDLVLVAEPHFFGLLRQELSKPVAKLVAHVVTREYYEGVGAPLERKIHTALERVM
jgi:hypothetical protein